MATEKLIYRSIGVPDAVSEANRAEAAAHRLARAAGLDVAADPSTSPASRARLEDARRVVEAATDAIVKGDFDEVIGGYGYRDDDWFAASVIRKLDVYVYENALACATELVRMLRSFVIAHPFEDVAGRPFN